MIGCSPQLTQSPPQRQMTVKPQPKAKVEVNIPSPKPQEKEQSPPTQQQPFPPPLRPKDYKILLLWENSAGPSPEEEALFAAVTRELANEFAVVDAYAEAKFLRKERERINAPTDVSSEEMSDKFTDAVICVYLSQQTKVRGRIVHLINNKVLAEFEENGVETAINRIQRELREIMRQIIAATYVLEAKLPHTRDEKMRDILVQMKAQGLLRVHRVLGKNSERLHYRVILGADVATVVASIREVMEQEGIAPIIRTNTRLITITDVDEEDTATAGQKGLAAQDVLPLVITIKGSLPKDKDTWQFHVLVEQLAQKKFFTIAKKEIDVYFEYEITTTQYDEAQLAEIIRAKALARGLSLQVHSGKHLLEVFP